MHKGRQSCQLPEIQDCGGNPSNVALRTRSLSVAHSRDTATQCISGTTAKPGTVNEPARHIGDLQKGPRLFVYVQPIWHSPPPHHRGTRATESGPPSPALGALLALRHCTQRQGYLRVGSCRPETVSVTAGCMGQPLRSGVYASPSEARPSGHAEHVDWLAAGDDAWLRMHGQRIFRGNLEDVVRSPIRATPGFWASIGFASSPPQKEPREPCSYKELGAFSSPPSVTVITPSGRDSTRFVRVMKTGDIGNAATAWADQHFAHSLVIDGQHRVGGVVAT